MNEEEIRKLNERHFDGNEDSLTYLESIAFQIKRKAASHAGRGEIVGIQVQFIGNTVELVAQIASRYNSSLDALKAFDKYTQRYLEIVGNEATFVNALTRLDSADRRVIDKTSKFLALGGLKDRVETYIFKDNGYTPSGNHGRRLGVVPLDEDSGGYAPIAKRALEDAR